MIHILVGAGLGAVLGVASVIVVAKLTGKPVSWKSIAANAIGGAVGGAITAATLGAAGAVAAPMARSVGAFAVGGFGGGVALKTTDNALEGRPLGKDVLESALDCTVTSAIAGAGGKVLVPVAKVAGAKLIPALPKTGMGTVVAKAAAKFEEIPLFFGDNVDNVKDATELQESRFGEDEEAGDGLPLPAAARPKAPTPPARTPTVPTIAAAPSVPTPKAPAPSGPPSKGLVRGFSGED